jgi:hypothetical protein
MEPVLPGSRWITLREFNLQDCAAQFVLLFKQMI